MSLSLVDRVRLASRALIGTFSADSATAAHGLLSGIFPGRMAQPPIRGTQQQLEGYSQMPWLRAVAGKIGDAVAMTEWQLYAPGSRAVPQKRLDAVKRGPSVYRKAALRELVDAGDLKPVEEHVFLDALDNMNEFETGFEARKITQVHIDLVGESFWLKERNGLGAPVGFWPLPPHWVQSPPTPANRQFRVGYRAWQEWIPDTEIVWFRDPDPAHPYTRGSGLARTLSDELETDENAAKFIRQFFYNSARPDFLVYPKGMDNANRPATLDEGEARRLEEKWLQRSQGFWRAFRPQFLTREVGIHEFDQGNLRAMQFTQLRESERNVIVQTFGFPPEILGILENSNRATIDAADYFFSRWVVVPRLEFQRAVMQERVVPEYDPRLILDYVSPVQEDKTHALAVATAMPGALTVDEWREMGGRPPLEDAKQGEAYILRTTDKVVEKLEEADPLAALLASPFGGPPGAPKPGGGGAPGATPAEPPKSLPTPQGGRYARESRALPLPEADRADLAAAAGVLGRAGDPQEAVVLRAIADDVADLPELVRLAARLEPELRRRFLAAVEASRTGINLGEVEAALRAKDGARVEQALRLSFLGRQVAEALGPGLRAGFDVGAAVAAGTLSAGGLQMRLDLVNPAAVDWVRTHGAELVTGVDEETRSAIRALIQVAFSEGRDVRQTARDLREVIGLTERQAMAVEAMRERLSADDGLDDSVVSIRTARYAGAQLRARAVVIARTEIQTASNQGQQTLWDEARRTGLLDEDTAKRKWILTKDGRQCDLCVALDGEEVGLREAFSDGTMTPPLHPQCRCTTGLVFTAKAAHVLTGEKLDALGVKVDALGAAFGKGFSEMTAAFRAPRVTVREIVRGADKLATKVVDRESVE